MKERLKELQQEAIAKIETATDLKALNDVRVAYLGKKGPSRRFCVEWGNYRLRSVLSWEHWQMTFVKRLLQV
jgi:hypothetical protein